MTAKNTPAATPFMAQYLKIKSAHPDSLLFFRMGDFYELFFDDAIAAAEALDITLTQRGQHQGDPIPMAGVPHHSAEPYLARLIRQGFRVAVCEQTESPAEARKRGSKSVVNRDVVRIVTPGTLTEDTLLDARSGNYLCAVARDEGSGMAVAVADISTGEFRVMRLPEERLLSEVASFSPREIIFQPLKNGEDPTLQALRALQIPLTPHITRQASPAGGREALLTAFRLSSADGLGDFSPEEFAAIGLLLSYVELTQAGVPPELDYPRRDTLSGHMMIDETTRHALEIERTQAGARKGSLLASIDRTVTAGGARLLASQLSRPLMDVDAIDARLDAIQCLLSDDDFREDIRQDLKGMPDVERVRSRVRLGRANPRDLVATARAIQVGEFLEKRLSTDLEATATKISEIASVILTSLADGLTALAQKLATILVDEPPLQLSDGGVIRTGADAELDRLRNLRDNSRKIIAALEAEYQASTGIAQLRIRFNNMLGYFIECPEKFVEALEAQPETHVFHRRQGLANATRYTTDKLSEIAREIETATDQSRQLEARIFGTLVEDVLAHSDLLRRFSGAVSELDVAAAGAEWAANTDASRPRVFPDKRLAIKSGRHPVVEAALRQDGHGFVSNDLSLEGDGRGVRLKIITGPNMAGKSTFLRQAALLVILAQSGWYVPAKDMECGLVDRVFSRVGASDDLARGKSTFMVEMLETASILNQASDRALVILDEVGRGTSTYDGLAIAWSCVEYLHDSVRCRGLFATHYHELTGLAARLPFAGNLSLKAREWRGDLIFLHEVQEGPADKSYGVQVARLAGLPKAAVARAKRVLDELEASKSDTSVTDDMPLFSFPESGADDRVAQKQAPTTHPAIDLLQQIDPDELSPKEALDALYQLRGLIAENR